MIHSAGNIVLMTNGINYAGTMHYFHHGAVAKSAPQLGFAERKWQRYAQLRTTLFPKWWHFAQYHRMDKLHVRWLKKVKHCKIKQLTMDAQKAFQEHDSFRLLHAISRSCPKQGTKRTHLKGADGGFLTPIEETATLYVQFIADNWKGPPIVLPELPSPGVPFTVIELNLNRSLQLFPRQRQLHQALLRDPCASLSSLQNGSLKSFNIGGA